MDNSLLNDENTPRVNALQNEKRKPMESPFSAFSPAQRLAKKKGRILCEPGDSNLEASMMEESILQGEHSDTMKLSNMMRPKVLFAEGDGADEDDVLSGDSQLDHSIVDPTQTEDTEGDRTFSAETRPYVAAAVDPNLDETYADMPMNQTFSNVVRPSIPSSIDPNLDETLADKTLNETFSNVVRPVVPSSVDPNMDETLAETTIDDTQFSVEDSMFVMAGNEDDFADDADRTLGEADGEVKEREEKEGTPISILDELNGEDGDRRVEEVKEDRSVFAPLENGEGGSLFEEINTISLTVPVHLSVKDEEESAVEASQENSMMKGGVSLFDELNTQSSQECIDGEKEENMGEMSMNYSTIQDGGATLFDEMNEMVDESQMDSSVLSTVTAVGMTVEEKRRQYYNTMKQRLSEFNSSMAPTPKVSNMGGMEKADKFTPTRCDEMSVMASPSSDPMEPRRVSIFSNTILESPGTPSRPTSRYNMMNDSHISFIMHEAEATNSVYNELRGQMEVLQEELSKSREMTEKVERERDNAKKEAEDYMFVMEVNKKKAIGEKTQLSKQIFELENELSEARRMSNVVEEEGRKVEEMERMKMILEEQKRELEERMVEDNEKYAAEKERLSTKADEMERQIEEERKKANEEMEKRLMECRREMDRKMEEILIQKNELIAQLEKKECESGEMEYTNEENERKLEGEKAMLETMVANLMREKKEMEEELERVKIEKEEADRSMAQLRIELEGITNAVRQMSELKENAFEESRIANGELEELKRVNEEMKGRMEEMKRGIEEKDKEMASLESTVSQLNASEGRMGEMEVRMKELEKEKKELEMNMKGMQMEKMTSQFDEMMNRLTKMNEEHFNEKSTLKEEAIELKRKIMEMEVEMKTKEKEVERSEKMRKGIEEEMEKMRGEASEKIESMETAYNLMKMNLDETKNSLNAANENVARMENTVRGMEEESVKRLKEMEGEKEREMKEFTVEIERLKEMITELNDGKTKMENEVIKKNEEIEMMRREIETEKEKISSLSQSEEAMREMQNQMEEARQRVANAESALTLMNTEKEEVERRVIEENGQKEEIMRMMEEMKKEKDEMKERMEKMQKEREIEKESSSHQLNEAMKNAQIQLENEREEKKMISLRLNEMENAKMEAEKRVEAERDRNDILSATVKQLENDLDRAAMNEGGFDEEEKKKLEEELKEEKETVIRLKKDVKRLEDACDEFDDIEWKLKEAVVEKQKKIDALEGKTKNSGPSLLDALKPTTTEVKSMNETVMVDPSLSLSASREVAGKEEKEDEEMKEEYRTPSGSIMEEEDRKEEEMNGDANETLGVTKIDATRYDADEEEYENANQTRPNASCRQS